MKNLLRRMLFGAAVLLASAYGGAWAQGPVVVGKAYSEVYHTRQATATEVTYCSATAIGPRALLTATHCELGTGEITLQGKDDAPDTKLKVDREIRDDADHTILFVSSVDQSGFVFPAFASVDVSHKFGFGQDIFFIGNPHGFSNVFRKGYVAGHTVCTTPLGDSIPEILLETHVGEGDSGAGIFDETGTLIGVVAGIEVHGVGEPSEFRMPYILALDFTAVQIKDALSYGAKK